jgi:hypothetical protein
LELSDDQAKKREKYFEKYGIDRLEAGTNQIMESDYPATDFRYRLIHDSFQVSLEASYFWVLNYLRYDLAFIDIDKITDIFTASEQSAFFGVAQQRLGLQQDKVSQYLATVGKMVKELFQLVRELRILDERLDYYKNSASAVKSIAEPAEITLKGIFIDMAEGGAKSPASVYGMARDLQFTILPDLFFGTNPKSLSEVGDLVDKLEFNSTVKNVLKRKLNSYYQWKQATHKELDTRKTFTLKYFRQHFNIIQMYMNWVKPYLKNIRRMQMDSSKTETPDLVAAFEGSMVELEILAKFTPEKNKRYKGVILATFEYRTMPQMSYVQEGYQRGPLHVGEVKMTLRPYAWTDDDINNYKQMRDIESFELLGVIDLSVKAAIEALGSDIQKYLEEAGEIFDKKEGQAKVVKQKMNMLEPFTAVFDGFAEVFGALSGPKTGKKKDSLPDMANDAEIKKAKDAARNNMWLIYKNYKKANQMIAW